jgi:hypothetical protein
MCLYLDCDDPNSECRTVDLEFSHQLIDSATHFVTADDLRQMVSSFLMREVVTRVERNKCLRSWETYFKRRQKIFSKVVHRPYTLFPIQNAFRGLHFGAWDEGGIFEATSNDLMHSSKLSLMQYIGGESCFHGLAPKEKSDVETLIRKHFLSPRSTARKDYPRWRIQPGFSRQTLMMSSERVGTIFLLALSLQIDPVRRKFCVAHERQKVKYKTPPLVPMKDSKKSQKRRGYLASGQSRGLPIRH